MKQTVKSMLTYNKILNAAIVEFGTKSYDGASINNICTDNNISKGLIYHHFKNKDELYLRCVDLCFKDITAFLSNAQYNSEDFNENIKKLLDLRYQFFKENPHYSHIFLNTVLQPPKSLTDEIKKIRTKFDQFNSCQYRKILKQITLRDNISEEDALEYFFILGEMFNGYFKNKANEHANFHSLIYDHEIQLSKILNIMLYGIVKEDSK